MASERMLQFVGREQSYPDKRSPEERARDIAVIRKGLDYCAAHGITSVQNMDGSLYQLEMLEEIEREGGLPVRMRMPFHMKNFMPLSDLETKAAAWRPPHGEGGHRRTAGAASASAAGAEALDDAERVERHDDGDRELGAALHRGDRAGPVVGVHDVAGP